MHPYMCIIFLSFFKKVEFDSIKIHVASKTVITRKPQLHNCIVIQQNKEFDVTTAV